MGSISNNEVHTADLKTINFAALEQKDSSEYQRLLDESVSAGFFYLDFVNSKAAHLPQMKKDLLEVMDRYFRQPEEVKLNDSKGVTTRGYVKKGTFSAVDPNKPKESFEHLAIGTYDLMNDAASTLPALYREAGSLVPDYIATCEYVVDVLLSCYSDLLGLDKDSTLLNYHKHTDSSDTILALLSYPERLTHQKHTDLGSLTILFSDQWGLQVITPGTSRWEWVVPRVEDAVINVGDALRFLSGKSLYSCLHRVIRDGVASGEGHRYSIAYLLRPGDDTLFEDADGAKVTAKALKEIKYHAYSAAHDVQKQSVLTGGMEKILGVNA